MYNWKLISTIAEWENILKNEGKKNNVTPFIENDYIYNILPVS